MKKKTLKYLGVVLAVCIALIALYSIAFAKVGSVTSVFTNVQSDQTTPATGADDFGGILITATSRETANSVLYADVFLIAETDWKQWQEDFQPSDNDGNPLTWEKLVEENVTNYEQNWTWDGSAVSAIATKHVGNFGPTQDGKKVATIYIDGGLDPGNYFTVSFFRGSGAGDFSDGIISVNDDGMVVTPQSTLVLDPNGGTFTGTADATVSVSVDADSTLDAATINGKLAAKNITMAQAGYKLAGWSIDENAQTPDASITAPSVGNSLTVYAIWEAKTAVTANDFVVSADVTYNADEQRPTITLAAPDSGVGTPTIVDIWADTPHAGTADDSYKVVATDADTYTIVISVPETETHAGNSALTLTDTWTINPAELSIAADPATAMVTINSELDVAGNFKVTGLQGQDAADGNYAISYALDATTYASITGSKVTGTAETPVGTTAKVTATLAAANDNYTVATSTADLALTVSLGEPNAVEAGADVTKTYGDNAFSQVATAAVGTPNYTSSEQDVATVGPDGLVTIKGAGTTIITATVPAGDYGGVTYAEGKDTYTLTVSPKAITLDVKAEKVYDGDNVAAIADIAAPAFTVTEDNEIVGADTLTITAFDGTYESKDVHANKAGVVTSSTVSGIDANADGTDDYTVTVTMTGTITKAALVITPTVTSKVYGETVDLTDAANFTLATLATGDAFDTIGLEITNAGAGENANVGNYNYGYKWADGAAQNYNVSFADAAKALAVTPKEVTVTAEITKYFDGTDDLTAANKTTLNEALAASSDIITGDTVQFSFGDTAYSTADVHTSAALTYTTLGLTNSNYALAAATDLTGVIEINPVQPTGKGDFTVNTSKAANLTIGDFLASAVDGNGKSVLNLFRDPIDPAGGIFNGITLTITDADGNNLTEMPTTPGAYNYALEVVGAPINDQPATGYQLLSMNEGIDGVLTVVENDGKSGNMITYLPGDGGSLASGEPSYTEIVEDGETPSNPPVVIPDEGKQFIGWSVDGKTVVDLDELEVDGKITLVALYKEYQHIPYMIGRAQGLFAPTGNLTRAESATMLSRLTAGFIEGANYGGNSYPDVNVWHWAYNYISFADSADIITGYETGKFLPDNFITRAEFAAMVCRFMGIEPVSGGTGFIDTIGHWAEGYIAALVRAGIIDGYPEDNTFRPNNFITRAEAAKIVNGAINRIPRTTLELSAMGYVNPFVDVSTSTWYYEHVMEATILHEVPHFH